MTIYSETLDIPRQPYLGGGHWKLRKLNEIVVVFGKNGSGKSLLLRGGRDLSQNNHHYVVPERSGQIVAEPGYIRDQADGTKRAQQSKGNLSNRYHQDALTRIQAYLIRRGAQREVSLKGSLELIENAINILLPDFSFTITGDEPPFRLSRISSNEEIKNIDNLSSGESQVFTLAADILTIAALWDLKDESPRVLFVDEPDAHLHPDLQQRLAEYLVYIKNIFSVQIFVATHSTTLLSALGHHGRDATSVIYLDNSTEEQIAVQFDKTLEEIATCLGGHALMGPLFATPILLVEGDDDYRIWSQVPRHNIVRIAVIPCHGDEIKQYQKTLEKIFGCLLTPSTSPSGYALIDGDKSLPQPNPGNPQIFVRFLQLKCRESENLYLCDEVLAEFEMDWNKAAEMIKAGSGTAGQKKSILDSVDSWDRKNGDYKNVIEEVSRIIDSKHLHWTIRVGKCIGKQRPTGQLAEYLGQPIIEALWDSIPIDNNNIDPQGQ